MTTTDIDLFVDSLCVAYLYLSCDICLHTALPLGITSLIIEIEIYKNNTWYVYVVGRRSSNTCVYSPVRTSEDDVGCSYGSPTGASLVEYCVSQVATV